MLQAFEFVLTIAGLLLIVPAVTLIATRNWSRTWEATRGYATVLFILIGLPALIGCVIAVLGLPFIE